MADIFVSYAAEDRDRIKPLVERLLGEGWSVWWDRDLVAGPSFDEKIEEALDAARCVVVAWSSNSVKSRWCRAEANDGLERRILVPLQIENVRPPLAFRSSQTASLVDWPANRGELDTLIAGIRECLGGTDADRAEQSPIDVSITTLVPDPVRSNSTRRSTVPHIARLGFLALFVVLLVYYWMNQTDETPQPWKLPEQLTAFPPTQSLNGAAISSDGKLLAFVRDGRLFLQTMDTREPHEVPLQWNKVPYGVVWAPDATRLYLVAENRTLWSVSHLGGRPRQLLDRVELVSPSPNGETLAVIRLNESGVSRSTVWVVETDGTKARELLSSQDESYWHLAWTPDSNLLTVGILDRSQTGGFQVRLDNVPINDTDRTTVLEGADLFQNWTAVLPFTWCMDGRLIFALRDGPTHQVTSNIWIATVAPNYENIINRQRLTHWVASNVRAVSATSDCSQIVALRTSNQLDVYIGEMGSSELTSERQITFDERQDLPVDWHPDANKLLFVSSRSGSWELLEQHLDEEVSPTVWSVPGGSRTASYAMGGDWIAHVSDEGGMFRSSRINQASESVIPGQFESVQCVSSSSHCVAGHFEDHEYVFTGFDLLHGEAKEVARTAHRQPFTTWALAPEGNLVAVVHNDNNEIKVIDLLSGSENSLLVENWRNFEFVGWSADGEGLVVNASRTDSANASGFYAGLIHVSFPEGKSTLLRLLPQVWHVYPIPAPDGSHIAYANMKFHSNAWLIENR